MPLGNNESMNVMQWTNQIWEFLKVQWKGLIIRYFFTVRMWNATLNSWDVIVECCVVKYTGVSNWSLKLTVSGIVYTFSYLGATHLLTLKHCLSQFVLHVMAKVLNKKPRNKRNRCTVRRTPLTWTWLTQTPTNFNKMQFPSGLTPVFQSLTIS